MGAQRPKPTAYLPMYAGFCDTTMARQATRKLGDKGFHAYVRMLCLLLNETGGRLPLALDDEWDDLADRLGVSMEDARELVALMDEQTAPRPAQEPTETPQAPDEPVEPDTYDEDQEF